MATRSHYDGDCDYTKSVHPHEREARRYWHNHVRPRLGRTSSRDRGSVVSLMRSSQPITLIEGGLLKERWRGLLGLATHPDGRWPARGTRGGSPASSKGRQPGCTRSACATTSPNSAAGPNATPQNAPRTPCSPPRRTPTFTSARSDELYGSDGSVDDRGLLAAYGWSTASALLCYGIGAATAVVGGLVCGAVMWLIGETLIEDAVEENGY